MEKEPTSFYTIRFGDCDPFGHLNNSRYLDYCLNAREDHLRDHYGIDLKAWAAQGIGFVVNRHEIRYIRPVGYNDRVCIQSSLIGWGDTWLQVEMLVWDEPKEQLKAVLWTVFTRIDTKTGAKTTHPGELVDWIAQVVLDEGSRDLDERMAKLKSTRPR